MKDLETLLDWERRTGRKYPIFAAVWYYQNRSQNWKSDLWMRLKDEVEIDRSCHDRGWDNYHLEPLVCDPLKDRPRRGQNYPALKAKIEGKQ